MLSKIDKVIKKVDNLMLKATCEDSEEKQAKILAKARLLLIEAYKKIVWLSKRKKI